MITFKLGVGNYVCEGILISGKFVQKRTNATSPVTEGTKTYIKTNKAERGLKVEAVFKMTV